MYKAHRSRFQQTTDIDIALKVVAIDGNRRKDAKPPGATVATAVVVVLVSATDCATFNVPPVVGMLELIGVIPACNTHVVV